MRRESTCLKGQSLGERERKANRRVVSKQTTSGQIADWYLGIGIEYIDRKR